jgi:hypothetical protein
VTVTEEYGWVKWQLPIGIKIMVRGLATSEWGERLIYERNISEGVENTCARELRISAFQGFFQGFSCIHHHGARPTPFLSI